MAEADKQAYLRLNEILALAIDSIDRCPFSKKRGKAFRHEFIYAVGLAFGKAQHDSLGAAMSNPNIDVDRKVKINTISSVATLYIATILQMISDGNAQWDDPVLLPEQFKHHIRKIADRSEVVTLTGLEEK